MERVCSGHAAQLRGHKRPSIPLSRSRASAEVRPARLMYISVGAQRPSRRGRRRRPDGSGKASRRDPRRAAGGNAARDAAPKHEKDQIWSSEAKSKIPY